MAIVWGPFADVYKFGERNFLNLLHVVGHDWSTNIAMWTRGN